MALVSSLVGKVETPVSKGKSIGTAYPVADGYILTAHHVIPDINDLTKTQVFWQRNDDARNSELLEEGEPITEILYEDSEYDIIIAKCKTPESLSKVVWSTTAKLSGEWESIGFPKTGKDYQLGVRLKDVAWGTFSPSQDDDWIQQLGVDAVPDVALWGGMSGAPVFVRGSDELAGIIVETPRKYLDKAEQQQAVCSNRLYALSIPYLRERGDKKCRDEFNQALGKIALDASDPEKDGYFSLAEPLLEQRGIYAALKESCIGDAADSRAIFDQLVSLSAGDFFKKLVGCQQAQDVCPMALGKLSGVLLPLFVDPAVVASVRERVDKEAVSVNYSLKLVIESLMARVDGFPTDFLEVKPGGDMVATYALPASPECCEEDDRSIKTLGQDLSNKFANDLVRFATHTKYLLRKSNVGDVAVQLTDEDLVDLAKLQLEMDRQEEKRRYYLICNKSENADYQEKLKKEYPLCAIVNLKKDSKTLLEEFREYNGVQKILAPYLNQNK